MRFREVDGFQEVDGPVDGTLIDEAGVVMLDPLGPDEERRRDDIDDEPASLRALWQRIPVPRVLVPAVAVAALLGAAAGAAVTHGLDRGSLAGIPQSALEVRLDNEALREGLDVYGMTRPALPLQINNRDRRSMRVAQLTYTSSGGRFIWYGDASAIGPGEQGRIWGESEISCGVEGESVPGLFAYVLLPDGSNRTLQLVDPGSLAVFQETLQRACG